MTISELIVMNHTELARICKEKGLPEPSRSVPRETVARVLLGELPPETLGTPLARHRKAIAKFIEAHSDVTYQLRCDLDHDACPAARVLDCFGSADEIRDHYE